MHARRVSVSVGMLAALWVTTANAVVNIETVPVGNPGNAGELSGEGAGGVGPAKVCGAVGYAYNIGKYEVTAGQYCEFLNAVAATDTYGLYTFHMDYDAYPHYFGCNIRRTGSAGSYTYNVSPEWADRPVNIVSWGDAARFCNWLHNGQPSGVQDLSTTEDGAYFLNGATDVLALLAASRKAHWKWAIASEDEWYKAAYHKNDGVTGNYYDWPTASDSQPSNDLINPDPGNNASFVIPPSDYSIGSPYWRTVVGEFENSESPYGTFDQGGNVFEWTEVLPDESICGLQGGSFTSWAINMQASIRNRMYPTYADYYIGFRVVQVPEPGTIMMLALVAMGMLRKRGT